MMMKYALLLPLASAFTVQPLGRPVTTLSVGKQFEGPPVTETELARAHECTEKLGVCDVDEMEELRDTIHDTRVKTMLMNSIGGAGAPVHNEDKLIEQRLLEEDLSLQLNFLQTEMPEAALFPEEATMHPPEPEVPSAPVQATLTLVDENLLESLAVCAVLGVIVFAPHLLN